MSEDYQSNTAKLSRQTPPFLPEELIFDILLRCPVKFLIQLKCICKSWKTIISHHQFTHSHIRRLTGNPSTTYYKVYSSGLIDDRYRNSKIKFYPSDHPKPVEFDMEHKFIILGSCNGLLCLFHINQGYVKLWNPSIRYDSRNSPPLDFYNKNDTVIRYNGFGYDHVNDKYKVLVSVRHGGDYDCARPGYKYVTTRGGYKHVTRIYTFGEDCWTTVQNFRRAPIDQVGKFVSGTLNWLVGKKGVLVKNYVGSISNDNVIILSFDLEKETYRELLLPEDDGVLKTHYNHELGVFNNCLCVQFDNSQIGFDFWLMKNYGVVESWTKLKMAQKQFPMRDLKSRINRHIYHESLVAPQC